MTPSIAWVTPFSNRSDVSAFSRNIVIELEAEVRSFGGSVTLFVNQNGPAYWTSLPVVTLTGETQDREILRAYDYVIFNIGNNSGNHRHINWLAFEVPGIVIVHDIVMQHFFADEIFGRIRRKDLYARLIGNYYTRPGLIKIEQSQICSETRTAIYAPWDTVHVAAMPLLEPFIASAAAVVVHSAYAERFVLSQSASPVLRLGLPWDQKPYLSEEELSAWRQASPSKTIHSVVCFGYIGRAKCLDMVIKAFAQSDQLRQKARLIIAGYPGDADHLAELKALVQTNALTSVVEFELSVSDQRLLALKQQADAFVNLRHPNTESASGSMIEQLNAGKPVVVYPTGCYAEIDDDAVIKIDQPDGPAAIASALEHLIADAAGRIAIGERGRQYARKIGRREYVRDLLAFLRQQDQLLRRRKSCWTGQCIAEPIAIDDADEPWRQRLAEARRLMAEFHRPRHELAVQPFAVWPDQQLLDYVVFGLFGQASGSGFERDCHKLFACHTRQDFYWIIGRARLLWQLCLPHGQTPDHFETATLSPCLDPGVWALLRCAGDEGLAHALYIGLLGRRAGDDEVSAYVRRLAVDPLERLVREFLHSVEFRRRSADAAAVANLLLWCEQEQPAAIAFPQLELDGSVYFAASFPACHRFLGAGWHEVETDHVWSKISAASLQLSVTESTPDPICLAVTGRLTGTAQTWARILHVRCARATDISIAVDSDDWFWFAIDLGPGDKFQGNVSILFDTETTTEGSASDNRELGFCLQSISLCRAGSARALSHA